MNSILKQTKYKRWQLCCLLFFIVSCNAKNDYPNFTITSKDSVEQERNALQAFDSIIVDKRLVKTGDVILRTGKDFTSETMRLLSLTDKTYSHCGIASIEHDSLFVYHSIGGEWNPDQKLRRDPFELFCNPYENRGFGIFRYKLTLAERDKLISTVKSFYAKHIRFDMLFNLESDDRMYCSEFVYKSLMLAGDGKIIIPITIINNIRFVALDNLFINPFCFQIKRVVFSAAGTFSK